MKSLTIPILVIVITALAPGAKAAPPQQPINNAPAPRLQRPPGHKEEPHDPPAPRSALNQRTVSRAAIVTRGRFTSVQVNVNAAGMNVVGDAANEPSMAIDPTDPNLIAIGWRQFDTIASNFRQAGNAFSQDGGQTWTFPGVLTPGQFRSDPVLGADPDGIFYYSSLSTLSSIEVFRSFDGGMTWGLPVPAFGGDKQWIAVDRTVSSGRGFLYQIWNVQFTCCGVNDFTRTTDQGLSFDGPFAVALPSMKWGTMDVDPDGRLFLAGSTLGQTGHLVSRSSDAKLAGGLPTFDFVNNVNLGGVTSFSAGPNPAGLLGQVWIKVDHSSGPSRGNVYILGSVVPPGPDPLDVMFIRSEDGGLTWSSPVRVNDDDPGSGAWQWFGTMSVAPNGRIDVVYNDTRTSGVANLSETFYTFSNDQGRTWAAGEPISPMFNSHVGFPQQDKLGDYYEMISDDTGANLAYAATFNGEQDVYFVRIEADCNDNGFPDDQDIAAGRSGDCDGNAIPDECQLDCNGNMRPDSCDIADGLSEDCNANSLPDECDTGFDCTSIRITEDGPPCLETQITLLGTNESGEVTIAATPMPPAVAVPYANAQLPAEIDISTLPDGAYTMCVSATETLDAAPDSITFEALNSSCGPGGLYEFFLNGVSVATVDADPTDACTCGAGVQSVPVVDPALLANWNVGGSNTLRVVMTGGAENLAWVRARIVRGVIDETVCVFTTALDCTDTSLCNHNLVLSPVDVTTPVAFERRTACRDFTKQGETRITINTPCIVCGVPPAAPSPDPAAADKNRYLSAVARNPGLDSALRVTLVASDLFPQLVGQSWWVGPPQTICENAGQISPPPEGCGPAGGGPRTTTIAPLQCTPDCRDWSAVGLVHPFGDQIVPGARYEIQTVSCGCDPADPTSFSIPLPLATSMPGDVCGPGPDVSCQLGPDSIVDILNDVVGVVDKFANRPAGPAKTLTDIATAGLLDGPADHIIDVADMTAVLDAFRGTPPALVQPTICP